MKSQFSLKNNQQDRGTEVVKVYFEKSLDYDVYNDMKNYDGKVLIVHRTSDNIAPISYSRRAIETFKDARLKEIPGAGHGFRGAQQEESTKAIIDFVKESIQGDR